MVTMKIIKGECDAVVKEALRKLPAKIDCSSLVKDDLGKKLSLFNSNIKVIVTDGRDGFVCCKASICIM